MAVRENFEPGDYYYFQNLKIFHFKIVQNLNLMVCNTYQSDMVFWCTSAGDI
jgi:hypothetical protein